MVFLQFHRVQSLISSRDWSSLIASDQLARELDAGRVFSGFCEGRITFAPTYRLEKGRAEYSNKRFQNASYTDRVLWRSRAGRSASVSQLYYDAVPQLNISDHRPVAASFLVNSQLPYLSLDRVNSVLNSANRNSCVISLAYVRYDDVVLSRCDQMMGSLGLDVSPPVQSIQKARAKVLSAHMHPPTAGTDGSASSTAEGATPITDWGATAAVCTNSSGIIVGIGPVPSYAMAGTGSHPLPLMAAGTTGTTGVPMASAGASAVGSGSLPTATADVTDFQSFLTTKPEDYYLEISAPFLEDNSVSGFGANALTRPMSRLMRIGTAVAGAQLAAAVEGSAALTALAVASEASAGTASQAAQNLGSVSAQWGPEALSEMVSQLSEPHWLQSAALHVVLKRKGGIFVGEADVPLQDAYYCMMQELPLASNALTLQAVLEQPTIARMFSAYMSVQLSSESLDFYRATVAFQELCSAGEIGAPPEVRLAAGHVIFDTFVSTTGDRMINIPGTIMPKLRDGLAAADAALAAGRASETGELLPAATLPSNFFLEAGVEVYRSMERDSLPGFRTMYASVLSASGNEHSLQPPSGSKQLAASVHPSLSQMTTELGMPQMLSHAAATPTTPAAPFCMPLVRDGCTVGLLRGSVLMSAVDSLADKSQRLSELQRFLRRRSSTYRSDDASAGNTARESRAGDASGAAATVSRMKNRMMPASPQGNNSSLPLNNVQAFTRLSSAEQARIKACVDALVDPSIQLTMDDFLLTSDVLLGSALMESDGAGALASESADAKSSIRQQNATLMRAAMAAMAASSGDTGVTTRALRSLLHIAISRLMSLQPPSSGA